MPQLIIKVQNKIAKPLNNLIVCGNSDYTVKFVFDKEWNDQSIKTARFIWNNQYRDVVFEGDTCPMPIISNATTLGIGVYAGSLSTTTPAIITCTKSVLCGLGCPEDPPEEVYNQIVELLNESLTNMSKSLSGIEAKHNTDINKLEAKHIQDTDNLQNQIDNIVIETGESSGDVTAEVAQARVGADGTNHTTLKDRLDIEENNLKEITTTGVIKKEYNLEVGGINSSGTLFSDADYMRTTDYLSVADAISTNFKIKNILNTITTCSYYDENKIWQSRVYITNDFELDNTYPYFKICFYREQALGSADEEFFRSAIEWYTSKSNISGDNTNFLNKKVVNLFNGEYVSGVKLGGNTSPVNIQTDNSFNSLAIIEVKPNTTYSAIIEDCGKEDGYYYIKICEVYLDGVTAITVKGAANTLLYANTATYPKAVTVTTSENATYLLVQTSKSLQPFLQVVEGVQTDFTVDNYNTTEVWTPNEKLDVYSKEEVNSFISLKNTGTTFSKTGNNITITTDKAQYTFKRVTATNINVDTWRLYQGDLIKPNGGGYFTMWKDSDAEGAIKIVGEDDFVCGYHGDEIMTSIKIFVDGKEIDLNNDYETTTFNEIDVFVESDVYHCNTSTLADTKAFTRNKMLIFKGNTVKIANHFTALTSLNIDRAAICLFQCYYKDSSNNEIFSNYSVNTDYKSYSLADTSVYPVASEMMTEAWMETAYANINFKSIKTSGQKYLGAANVGFVSTQNRLKFYFDTISTGSTTIAEGEELYSEFEFTIA